MELTFLEVNHQKIARVVAEHVVVTSRQDALDIIANAYYQEATSVILEEKQLDGQFFDLRSGLAGEILQKCVNYRMKLAVIGDFEKFTSKSLKAFITESNRGNLAFFVPDMETALNKIAG